ncbi:hypothetical protein [Micromonospora tulbaghiae]|uniref:hypothetical protein n=1 Tax=Micromonospora tulbaghiae TaxID=479978 RepID=UPI003EBD6343
MSQVWADRDLEGVRMPVTADLTKLVGKAYQDKTPSTSPPSATWAVTRTAGPPTPWSP